MAGPETRPRVDARLQRLSPGKTHPSVRFSNLPAVAEVTDVIRLFRRPSRGVC